MSWAQARAGSSPTSGKVKIKLGSVFGHWQFRVSLRLGKAVRAYNNEYALSRHIQSRELPRVCKLLSHERSCTSRLCSSIRFTNFGT